MKKYLIVLVFLVPLMGIAKEKPIKKITKTYKFKKNKKMHALGKRTNFELVFPKIRKIRKIKTA